MGPLVAASSASRHILPVFILSLLLSQLVPAQAYRPLHLGEKGPGVCSAKIGEQPLHSTNIITNIITTLFLTVASSYRPPLDSPCSILLGDRQILGCMHRARACRNAGFRWSHCLPKLPCLAPSMLLPRGTIGIYARMDAWSLQRAQWGYWDSEQAKRTFQTKAVCENPSM